MEVDKTAVDTVIEKKSDVDALHRSVAKAAKRKASDENCSADSAKRQRHIAHAKTSAVDFDTAMEDVADKADSKQQKQAMPPPSPKPKQFTAWTLAEWKADGATRVFASCGHAGADVSFGPGVAVSPAADPAEIQRLVRRCALHKEQPRAEPGQPCTLDYVVLFDCRIDKNLAVRAI